MPVLASPPVQAAPAARRAFNVHLEALRGLAAVVVVWHHVIYHQRQLDPGFVPAGIFAYDPPGHFAVLIFFLLSGYVIGLSHPEPLRGRAVLGYLRKRLVRLYPMYVVAVLAGLAVSGFSLPGAVVLQHLGFGQGWSGPVMFENNPLWSLQYEVLFYLAFIPFSRLAARPWLVALLATGTGIALLFTDRHGPGKVLAQYFIGFSFWALGWAFSTWRPGPRPTPATRLVSALLLLLSITSLNPLAAALQTGFEWLGRRHLFLNSPHWALDYASLPYAALIVLTLAGINRPAFRRVALGLQLLPLYSIWRAVKHQSPAGGLELLVLPGVLYAASWAFYFAQGATSSRLSHFLLRGLVPLGAISYGLYVIHFPILYLFGRVSVFSGSALTFGVRAVVYLPLVLLAATCLDKYFQPWIKKRLLPGA